MEEPVGPLPPAEQFAGAGIYAIYYDGACAIYKELADLNRGGSWRYPIYVGKAVPKGARKGGAEWDLEQGPALFGRLKDHASSIEQAASLELDHFRCRYLVVDDIWIPLGESLLIQMFRPVWNQALDGFGNHDPGSRRAAQYRSPWDVVHPGRQWADRLAANPKPKHEIEELVRQHLLMTLPKI